MNGSDEAARAVAERSQPSPLEMAIVKADLLGRFDDLRLDRFRARVAALIDRLRYRDWTFGLERRGQDLFLRIRFVAPDSETGEAAEQFGRPWLLSAEQTDGEIVRTAWLAVLTAEEHEARERFLLDGRPLFGPHFDIPHSGASQACPER